MLSYLFNSLQPLRSLLLLLRQLLLQLLTVAQCCLQLLLQLLVALQEPLFQIQLATVMALTSSVACLIRLQSRNAVLLGQTGVQHHSAAMLCRPIEFLACVLCTIVLALARRFVS